MQRGLSPIKIFIMVTYVIEMAWPFQLSEQGRGFIVEICRRIIGAREIKPRLRGIIPVTARASCGNKIDYDAAAAASVISLYRQKSKPISMREWRAQTI